MNVYVIKRLTGDVLAVNRTTLGVSMELYGLDVEMLGDQPCDADAVETAMSKTPSIRVTTTTGEILEVERHYLGN